jgi:hypothetical protein
MVVHSWEKRTSDYRVVPYTNSGATNPSVTFDKSAANSIGVVLPHRREDMNTDVQV